MEYSEGKQGRIFLIRFDHNENIIEELEKFSTKENIKYAWIFCLGAIKRADIVCGPKETTVPPLPVWHQIIEGHEIIAIGNITMLNNEPAIHLHAGLGRADKARISCIRKLSETYLTIECLVMEYIDITIHRQENKDMGINTIHF